MMAASQFNYVIKINYPGSGNFSQFAYDSYGRAVKIVETVASTEKQFVWSASRMDETRDASGLLTAQYFHYGQTLSGTNYFYSLNNLCSISEMTNSAGSVQVRYSYDAFGQSASQTASLNSDFQYAGYHFHEPSQLNMAVYRFYSPVLARWINRDPLREKAAVNMFSFVDNSPTNYIDPAGLDKINPFVVPWPFNGKPLPEPPGWPPTWPWPPNLPELPPLKCPTHWWPNRNETPWGNFPNFPPNPWGIPFNPYSTPSYPPGGTPINSPAPPFDNPGWPWNGPYEPHPGLT